jgi:hypothetical protein
MNNPNFASRHQSSRLSLSALCPNAIAVTIISDTAKHHLLFFIYIAAIKIIFLKAEILFVCT